MSKDRKIARRAASHHDGDGELSIDFPTAVTMFLKE